VNLVRPTFRIKLLGIVGVAAASLAVLIALSAARAAQIERQLSAIRDRHIPRLEQGPRLNHQFERVRRALQDAVAAQDREALADTQGARDEFLRLLRAAPANGPDAAELETAFQDYYDAARDVSRRLIEGESGEALVTSMGAMQARQLRATELLHRATAFDQQGLADAFQAVSQSEIRGANQRLILSLCCLTLVLALSLWVSRGMVRSVAVLSAGFESFGKGELDSPIPVTSSDELGMLAERANDMVRSLARLHQERDRSDWIKTGQTRLAYALQGDLEPAELARRALEVLAEYLDLPAAAFYRSQNDGSLRALVHYARFADASDPSSLPAFQPGEGLVGRAAQQTELLVIHDLPEHYMRIRSGLGEACARSLVLMPLLHAGKLTGLVELAVWKTWTADHEELLRSVRETLAIAVEVASSRAVLRALLAQTQAQAERLGAQEEQLRAANEGLQTQQEELRSANLGLRTQAQALEEKNSELTEARMGLEQKAEELNAVSTYKSQFLANMSHELRTPLNSMLLLSNLLADNDAGNLTTKQVEYCRTIHGAGKDLLLLINQVLDLAKIESGRQEVRLERVEFAAVLQSAERLVGPLARDKGLEFVTELQPGTPAEITSDRHKLEQILTNLLGNAVKFTERGSVRLRVGPTAADTTFERPDLEARDAITIAVTDTGIGIAPEHQGNVFVQFQQVDARSNRRYGGTGLGLTIAKQLAHLLGGELRLDSVHGQGSTFAFHLPIAGPAQAATAADSVVTPTSPPPPSSPLPLPTQPPRAAIASAKPALPEGGTGTILVIEDDARFAEAVGETVHDQGLRCVIASDGQSGVRLAKELRPRGVILDVRLPDIDGFTVLEMLQADPTTAQIPVHFVSALDAGERGMAMGAAGYLTKPASRRDLVRVVQSLTPRESGDICRVLIVEDDTEQADSLARRLADDEIKIERAPDAGRALAALAKNRFHCVVLDLGLPDMDGLDLLRSIEEQCGSGAPPIVVYTGRPLTNAERQRLEAYAETVILKEGHGAETLLNEVRMFASRLRSGAPIKRKASSGPKVRLQGMKVLLVDDDMRTVYALSAMLRAKGAEVFVADNGIAAIEALDEHPDAEIVLMDMMMPEMDGYEAMRRIRTDARFQSLPIVALTAKAMKGDRDKCLEAGATDYLPKPIDPDRLLALLHTTLAVEVQEGA
jgi:CheY-like chemotaxis protein